MCRYIVRVILVEHIYILKILQELIKRGWFFFIYIRTQQKYLLTWIFIYREPALTLYYYVWANANEIYGTLNVYLSFVEKKNMARGTPDPMDPISYIYIYRVSKIHHLPPRLLVPRSTRRYIDRLTGISLLPICIYA